MKLCSKCDTSKGLSEFYRDYRNKESISYKPYCKKCNLSYSYKSRNKSKLNPEYIQKRRTYYKNKRNTDPLYKMSSNIRTLVAAYFSRNGYKKRNKLNDILGCDFNHLRQHLESLFTDNMSWENYGKWHIDHIIPVSFAKSEEEMKILNHYTNLQPLWAFDNQSKGNKIISYPQC